MLKSVVEIVPDLVEISFANNFFLSCNFYKHSEDQAYVMRMRTASMNLELLVVNAEKTLTRSHFFCVETESSYKHNLNSFQKLEKIHFNLLAPGDPFEDHLRFFSSLYLETYKLKTAQKQSTGRLFK